MNNKTTRAARKGCQGVCVLRILQERFAAFAGFVFRECRPRGNSGAVVVQGSLQYLPGVLAAGIEIMVPQEELNARMGVRTNPGTDGGGIVQNILKTAFPGFFLFSGVKQGFEAVEYGGFNAVADAADFPLAALVSGREAGNAQGGRPGDAVVFKAENGRSHLFFCSIHRFQ